MAGNVVAAHSAVLRILMCVALVWGGWHGRTAHAQTCQPRVMPLGDSITKGEGSNPSTPEEDTGYRDNLYNALISDFPGLDFVGSQINGPVGTFDRDHEGHPGQISDFVADNAQAWLQANPADMVLLHIGTNDLAGANTDASGVGRVLDAIHDHDPEIQILLAKIIDRWGFNNATTAGFNDNLVTIFEDRIANGYSITLVDMQLINPDAPATEDNKVVVYPDDYIDRAHPKEAGYAKMALVWEAALRPLLTAYCEEEERFIFVSGFETSPAN